jgi:Skp family chaperone for outer membrane proteins
MHATPLLGGAVAMLALLTGPVFAASSPEPAAAAETPAVAPRASPAANPQSGFGGPVIPGVCLLSRETVLTRSAVGQAASERMKQLAQKAQAGLDAERRKIEADAKALQGQQATLTQQQGQLRQEQLSARAQAYQAKAAQVSREMEATWAKVTSRIEGEIQPVVTAAYQAKGCGLLLSREAVLGGNLANDLTGAVVQGLDVRISTITFDREHLPPAPAAGGR